MTMFGVVLAYSEEQAESAAPSGCNEHPSRTEERYACARDFRHFLNHWHFKNREGEVVLTFKNLWPGQERAVEQMKQHRWLFLLKAGKLGFSELECAFDGWRALFGGMNTRVNILSKDKDAAEEMLTIVKFGLKHLPDWLGLPTSHETESDTPDEYKMHAGIDDTRRIVSIAATKSAAIDVSAHHTHVDEMARMPWPAATWSAVESTVAPGGTVHIVTRGNGDGNFASDLWYKSMDGGILHCHFEPWDARPRTPEGEVPEGVEANAVYYAERTASMLEAELNWFLPTTAEDALKGSSEGAFIQAPIWLACAEALPVLMPGDRTPLVLGMDAGVTNDLFACVAVSRHPDRPADPAVRQVKVWRPPKGGQIDFDAVERWVRSLCMGGCYIGHPNIGIGQLSNGEVCARHPDQVWHHRLDDGVFVCDADALPCPACAAGQRFERYNVVQIAYDAYQLVDMAQRLTRDRIAWCEPFGQGEQRMEADANLRLVVINRRLSHPNDPDLNLHIANANAKINAGEDTKMRIVKRNPGSKIDLAVATSMAVARCLYLVMSNAA